MPFVLSGAASGGRGDSLDLGKDDDGVRAGVFCWIGT